jgi:hypothetical protein
MAKVAVLLVLFVVNAFGQRCLKYGVSTTITGTLVMRDEAGYNQFLTLRPMNPICTEADPRDTTKRADEHFRKRLGVAEIQAGVYRSDPSSLALRGRLERLIGHPVKIEGDVFPATTGYHLTDIQLRVETVDPVDAAGKRALLAPKVPVEVKDGDLAAYDVTVDAGPRLVIAAYKSGSSVPLVPIDRYVSHLMTGGEVLYVNCRDGYDLRPIEIMPKSGASCGGPPGLQCSLSAFPKNPIVLKFRCTKPR